MTPGSRGIDAAPVNDPRAEPGRQSVGVAPVVPVLITMTAAAWNWLIVADVVAFPLATGVRVALTTWLAVAVGLTGLAFVHLRRRHVWSSATSWTVAATATSLGAASGFGWISLPI